MPRRRSGFSFIELLMVFAILGIVLAFGLPKFTDARASLAIRSARDNVSSYLATARAAAIRRGQPARFVIDGNTIDVQVQTAPGVFAPLTLRGGESASRRDLASQYAVTISPSAATTIEFNSRGFAQLGATQRIRLLRDEKRDSVCVSGMGTILRQGCW